MPEVPQSIAALPAGTKGWIDLLTSWAEINSGSAHLAGLGRMCAVLKAAFGELPGAIVEEKPLAGTPARALRFRARPGAPIQILFSGHYDTVYDIDHPFQHCTRIDAQTLGGPGVADMKGGLVVMLAALQAFEKTPNAANIGWEVLLVPDEETGSENSASLIAEAAGRHDVGLVFEPARANGDLVRSRKGTGIFSAICRGRAAHAGRDPSAGRNAILALAEFLLKADALNRGLPGVLLNVGHIKGGGATNIVPDLAQADINIRITRADDEALVIGRLREIAVPINAREGFHLEIEGRFNRPPREVIPAEERIFAAWKACGNSLGVDFSWQDVGGGSDGNLLSAAGLPNLDGLGVVGDHLHSPKEFVHLPSITERAQVAALFLHQLAIHEIQVPRRNSAS